MRFKGEGSFFATPQSPHQWTDQHQTWYFWLPRGYEGLCHFWWRSAGKGHLGNGVKYTSFSFFFSPSDPISTSKYRPILVVDTSNDVFPCVFDPPHMQIHINPILGGQVPQKPLFLPKSRLFVTCEQNRRCGPNGLTWNRRKWLRWRQSMHVKGYGGKKRRRNHRGAIVPQKPQILEVLWSAKKWKNWPKIDHLRFPHNLHHLTGFDEYNKLR